MHTVQHIIVGNEAGASTGVGGRQPVMHTPMPPRTGSDARAARATSTPVGPGQSRIRFRGSDEENAAASQLAPGQLLQRGPMQSMHHAEPLVGGRRPQDELGEAAVQEGAHAADQLEHQRQRYVPIPPRVEHARGRQAARVEAQLGEAEVEGVAQPHGRMRQADYFPPHGRMRQADYFPPRGRMRQADDFVGHPPGGEQREAQAQPHNRYDRARALLPGQGGQPINVDDGYDPLRRFGEEEQRAYREQGQAQRGFRRAEEGVQPQRWMQPGAGVIAVKSRRSNVDGGTNRSESSTTSRPEQ